MFKVNSNRFGILYSKVFIKRLRNKLIVSNLIIYQVYKSILNDEKEKIKLITPLPE